MQFGVSVVNIVNSLLTACVTSVTNYCEKTLDTLDTLDIKIDVDGAFDGFCCSDCGRDLTNDAYTYYFGELVCFPCFRKLEAQKRTCPKQVRVAESHEESTVCPPDRNLLQEETP